MRSVPFLSRDFESLPTSSPIHLSRVSREDITRTISVIGEPIARGIKIALTCLQCFGSSGCQHIYGVR